MSPISRVLPEKITDPELLEKIPAFFVAQLFISMFKSSHNLSLYWDRSGQSMPPIPPLLLPFYYYPHFYACRIKTKTDTLVTGYPSLPWYEALFVSLFPTFRKAERRSFWLSTLEIIEDKLQTYNKINGAIRRHFGKQMNKEKN